jgi:hypothetical protein
MSKHVRRGLVIASLLAAACASDDLGKSSQAATVSTDLVISQVYGGGGNTGATYDHDFVELVNIGSSTLQMSNYSIQYTTATGTFSSTGNYVDFTTASLAPGQYFLVELYSAGNNGTALPTPDATGTSINVATSGGKVALTLQTNKLDQCGDTTTPCNASDWVDLVGWGSSASQYEGTGAAAGMSNTTSDTRTACTDTGDNSADFTKGTPSAHNSSSTFLSCTTDAGTDAAVDAATDASDGGTTVIDSGTDSGTLDGGTLDSGTTDGGTTDGGTLDSGTLDGGTTDGGTTDGGTTDGGTTDGGTTDGGGTDGGGTDGGGTDGGITVDSGAKDSGAKDAAADAGTGGGGGGCSCMVRGSRSSSSGTGLGLFVAFGVIVGARRRRRRV